MHHPEGKLIIEKLIPDIASNPMVGMVKDLSLNVILGTPQAAQFGITKEKLESVLEEINKQIEKEIFRFIKKIVQKYSNLIVFFRDLDSSNDLVC
ncbi:MAG: hypothetical protein K0B14_09345 [Anaerolineaceae bacterium]|nr:hypothetical protein [Anaerolineaceae bacterium]